MNAKPHSAKFSVPNFTKISKVVLRFVDIKDEWPKGKSRKSRLPNAGNKDKHEDKMLYYAPKRGNL